LEFYTGTILHWGVPWAPEDEYWMLCQGQELPIRDAKYQELYGVIGNKFGGDGRNTFALPDLRTRVPIGAGQGVGLSNYAVGQVGGAQTAALKLPHLPAHSHTVDVRMLIDGEIQNGWIYDGQAEMSFQMPLNATTKEGNLVSAPAANASLGVARTADNKQVNLYTSNQPNVRLMNGATKASASVSGGIEVSVPGRLKGNLTLENNGFGYPFSLMQPYIEINYIICVKGIYPYRP